ncbi:hypothetical protein WB894_004201 [Vibrio vulnificus]|uniref:hypothetical protein n=1 Tax=Vibrio TaxID=662 RepID=UPI0005EE8AB5|nr:MULTISPECIES: hypothetical protein [Vibrio]ELQ2338066.1 hypothetical protein [Vibrio vulnificus]MCG9664820.1 hypothetical protein [Vibrio mediterranei]
MNKILHYAIKEAQDKYGLPIKQMNILKVKFRVGKPDTLKLNKDDVQVTVSVDCIKQVCSAYYQLSHEAIHTINPVTYETVSWFEEGVAVLFSHDFLRRHYKLSWSTTGDEKYDEAWKYINELLKIYPHAIKTVFEEYGRFSSIESYDVKKSLPKAPAQLLDKLFSPFNLRA